MIDAPTIAEDEALIAAATEGPYMIEPMNGGETYQITTSEDTGFTVICETESGEPQDLLNMEFQVAARTRWPLYVAQVKRLMKRDEPVKLFLKDGSMDEMYTEWFSCRCGCGNIMQSNKFCPNCGKPLEWS